MDNGTDPSQPSVQSKFAPTDRQKQAQELLRAGQRHTLLVGGSRSGKTTLLIHEIALRALQAGGSRHAILRLHANATRASIGLDTLPKVFDLWFPGRALKRHRADGYFSLENESEIWIGGLDDKERVEKILGKEYATIFLNECSQIPYSSVLVALTRLAQVTGGLSQAAFYDLNPTGKGHWTNVLFGDLRDPVSRQPLQDPDDYARLLLNPSDNAANLAPAYLKSLEGLPERQRKRFFEGAYSLLCAREMWYPRDRELISRWPTLALAVIHAGFLLTRIHYVGAFQAMTAAHPAQSVGLFVLAFETLFAGFCQAFLRMGMAKERAELAQRRAALTDSLTEIANRRAFFELGSPLLKRTLTDRRAAALLLFDLDRFKEVNDTAGHQAGDEVLKAFSRLVAEALQPRDLFARLGGEEFACLLVDAPMAEALRLAERVRGRFEAMRFAGLQTDTTVSVGVAMAGDSTGRDLSSLLATADRALYRAKAEGRNRVAPAPLVLVERSADGARQGVAQGVALGGVAAIPAPLAG